MGLVTGRNRKHRVDGSWELGVAMAGIFEGFFFFFFSYLRLRLRLRFSFLRKGGKERGCVCVFVVGLNLG